MSGIYRYLSVKLVIKHKQLINFAIHDNISSSVQVLVVSITDQNTITLNKNVSEDCYHAPVFCELSRQYLPYAHLKRFTVHLATIISLISP